MMRSCSIAILVLATQAGAEMHCGSGPAAIPDGTGSVANWMIDVPEPGEAQVITSARLMVDITHPWVGDLSMVLTAPGGISAMLLDRPGMPNGGWIGAWGCGGDNIVCMLDDAGSAAAEDTCSLDEVPVLGGNLQPRDELAVFNGLGPGGGWQVMVLDHSPIDAGSIQQLCLVLETAPDCNGNGVPDGDDIDGGSSEDADGDGIPDECQCMADIDGNGSVDVTDLLTVIADWGCTSGCAGDLDGNGVVNVTDLLAVISSWGECN